MSEKELTELIEKIKLRRLELGLSYHCLLYTSDAADE